MTDDTHPYCKSGCAGARLEERAREAERKVRSLQRENNLLKKQHEANIRAVVKEVMAEMDRE
jgi:hypothetical protein